MGGKGAFTIGTHAEVREHLVGVGSLLPPCRSGDQTQVVTFGGMHLYPLSHLYGSCSLLLVTKTIISLQGLEFLLCAFVRLRQELSV